ncbi:MAG: ABC transporter ATP-binding protein [Lawsonibacter sp.]|jgi:branched-chain amino acid transport system ATP-binding protein|uniref:ABC transporter ATP-binding protein n=1 Tax=Lawsonibacter sp. JLR.KK007 TaxID=3114293 RepID=UPI0021730287|nr:ABC transporter ATP-binding protein [Lawsonibacter sp.]
MKYILEVNDATKKFSGLMANEAITFQVEPGEVLGVVGPNGAGKTTLFNSLSGVHTLTRGSIVFNGTDITKMTSHQVCKLGIGRTFQIPQAITTLTVEENVLIGSLLHTDNMRAAREHAAQVVEFCGLSALAKYPASILNVAQKKRLEIARAYATRPKLLLLDETMAGLTATERADSVELIRAINGEGVSILTIEHNMDVVMNVSNRVLVLNAGKVLTIGTPEEVTSNEAVIEAYLGGGKKDA